MSVRKHIVPGDLVYGHKHVGDLGFVTRYGLVVGVQYARTFTHMGCEVRIKVMWHHDSERFSESCDCELAVLS